MKPKPNTRAPFFEMDGAFYHLDGQRLVPVSDLRDMAGGKWLATDFGEAMSRYMTVEGPAKYAELLVRRKLQESGELEEPAHIITHWKKKRSKNATDIFFTAVPSRLAGFYFDELRREPDVTLVFPMYGLLWETVQAAHAKEPVAVVLRHDRFAELLIGSRDQVYFASRCVAFDNQSEQLQALWENVRADIENVQQEHRIEVTRVICLTWLDAFDQPTWPEEWQQRLVFFDQTSLDVDGQPQPVSLPQVLQSQSIRSSASCSADKAFCYAQRWAPAVNLILVAAMIVLLVGSGHYLRRARLMDTQLAGVQQRIRQLEHTQKEAPDVPDPKGLIQFIDKLDRQRQWPSYQQILNDMTYPGFEALQVRHLKLDYTAGQVRVELFGEIATPFDEAHGGYQGFLLRLTERGYRIEESQFETQISTSQVVLKLSRPLA